MAKQYNKLNQFNTAPKEATKIGVFDASGNKVGVIPISGTSLDNAGLGNKLYNVGILSDIHLCNEEEHEGTVYTLKINEYESVNDFTKALRFFNSKGCIFTCGAGDIQALTANTSTHSDLGGKSYSNIHEYEAFKNILNSEYQNTPFFMCLGNHDDPALFNNYTPRNVEQNYGNFTNLGSTNSYYIKLGNDYYVFLMASINSNGGINNPAYGSAGAALTTFLNNHKNDRCFIFMHFPIYLDGYAGYWATSEANSSSKGVDSTITGLITSNNYPKTIWFSGHTHWRWLEQQSNNNPTPPKLISNNGNCYLVNIPSCAKPRWTSSTSRQEDLRGSQGAIMEVYQNGVIIKGIDFNEPKIDGQSASGVPVNNTDKIKYIPTATYKIMI